MIKLIDFYKSYESGTQDRNYAVENVTLIAETGKITGLIGPNGSGKTTIIKSMCGFHYATKGQVIVTDINGKEFDVSIQPEKAMELVGYVPEVSVLPQDMYVCDFLKYCAEIHNIKTDEALEVIKDIVKKCELREVLDKKIKTLSKGYKQRVSFAQSLIHNPPNIILDEPVSGLDPAQIVQMRDLIKKLSTKKTIIMSTHILQEVETLCENLYVITKGKLVANGTEKEIIEQTSSKNFEEAFIKLTK